MPEQILRLITFEKARKVEGDTGRTTQWRTRRDDPTYPKPIYRGGRGYLVEHEHQAWLAQFIERARRGAEPPEPDAGDVELLHELVARHPAARSSRRRSPSEGGGPGAGRDKARARAGGPGDGNIQECG